MKLLPLAFAVAGVLQPGLAKPTNRDAIPAYALSVPKGKKLVGLRCMPDMNCGGDYVKPVDITAFLETEYKDPRDRPDAANCKIRGPGSDPVLKTYLKGQFTIEVTDDLRLHKLNNQYPDKYEKYDPKSLKPLCPKDVKKIIEDMPECEFSLSFYWMANQKDSYVDNQRFKLGERFEIPKVKSGLYKPQVAGFNMDNVPWEMVKHLKQPPPMLVHANMGTIKSDHNYILNGISNHPNKYVHIGASVICKLFVIENNKLVEDIRIHLINGVNHPIPHYATKMRCN